jgi:PAS domain S-box-containing protein
MANHLSETTLSHARRYPKDSLDTLFDASEQGCLILDNQWKVLEVNLDYQQFHHYFNDVLIEPGMVINAAAFNNFPKDFFQTLNAVLSGQIKATTLQINFTPLSFEVNYSRVKNDEHQNGGVCVLVQKKEIQSSMLNTQTEDFYKLLIETSTSVYQLADAGLIVTYSSNSIEHILGYPAKELVGKKVLDFVHPDDKENVRDWFISLRTKPDKLYSLEYRLKNRQGEWIWIENNARNMLNNGAMKAIVMNFRNIQAKKIADHTLVQAEQRVSLLLNNTAESFIILNSRLRIVTYNKAAQEHSPYFFNQELQSGLSVLDLISKDEIPTYISLFEQVFQGKEVGKETKYVDQNNEVHVFNHTFRPLFDNDKDIFGVFITSGNITERKKLTEEVAVNSERLKTAQQIARLGYYEYDFGSGAFFCSQQFYEILGITKTSQSDIFFSSIHQLIHPEDKERVKKEIQASVDNGTDFNVEFRILVEGEKEKVILAIGDTTKNIDGKADKFRVTLQDITANKQAVLAIQTLETRFKSLFENSIDGVIISNEEGEILSANPSLCNLLGYTQQEMTSLKRSDILDINHPSVKDMMSDRTNTGSFVGELLFIHKQGYCIPADVTSTSRTDAEGNIYVSSIIRDITEKKKIEKEQKALTEELVKNNQDLQQFSFITSHNLRAPVANLLSLLSLYNKENPADEFNYVLIDKFQEATEQLNSTLNDLINVLVIKSNTNIQRETISFNDTYLEVRKNIQNLLIEKKGTLEADFSEVDGLVYSRIHLESIFLNMITNAIRYSSPDRKPQIKIRSYKEGSWIVVSFSDNGLGMDLERYGDRLFGLYQRFHENKEGKGLGLYMTRSQILAMGGKIEVESEPGVGTTFKAYFKIEEQ